jgi:hypothetical protein
MQVSAWPRLPSIALAVIAVACGNSSPPKTTVDADEDSQDLKDRASIRTESAVPVDVVVDPQRPDARSPDTTAARDTAISHTPADDADPGNQDTLALFDTHAPQDTQVDLSATPDLARTMDVVPDTQARDTAGVDAAVDAESSKPITLAKWPGGNTVTNASVSKAFGANLSGLIYQPAAGSTTAILWAVQNNPSKVYRLAWNETAFMSFTTDGWGAGKTLTYPNGSGSPDSEALTRTEWDQPELYVASEESNDAPSISRMSILRYDLSGTTTKLLATHEWNLTPDLPSTDPNKGLEAIAWIPDTFLVEREFYDENTKAVYTPASYANHGTGLFLVGMENTGMVYGYALDHAASTFKRVATFTSGQAAIMDMAFDRDTGTLWALCDSACNNRMTLLDIDTIAGSATKGRFILRATVPPPNTLTSDNNEGITMAPESECANNRKGFFWADDDESNGYAIRRDTIPCGRLF